MIFDQTVCHIIICNFKQKMILILFILLFSILYIALQVLYELYYTIIIIESNIFLF
jgi:hypothetical protein